MGVAIKLSNADFSTKKIKTIEFSDYKVLSSISATFSPGTHQFFITSTLESLRQYLVVTAIYEDETTKVKTNYELSGTLTEGVSVITVTYEDKTTTFNVNVSHIPVLESLEVVYTQPGLIFPSEPLNNLKNNLVVKAVYDTEEKTTIEGADYTLSGNLVVGTSTITVTYANITGTFDVVVTKEPELDHIVATYSAMDLVYPSTQLSEIKPNISVVAYYDDNITTYNVPQNEFILTGSLAEGTSTLTVTFSSKTTTIEVLVQPERTATSIAAVLTLGEYVVHTTDNLNTLKPYLVVTVSYDNNTTRTAANNEYTLSGTLSVGSSSIITVTYTPNAALTTTFTVPNVEARVYEDETIVYATASGIGEGDLKDKVDTFVKDLKIASIWDKCIAIYPFVAQTDAGMTFNLKDTTKYPLTKNSGTLVTGEGYTNTNLTLTGIGNYLDTNASLVHNNGLTITLQQMNNNVPSTSLEWLFGNGNGYNDGRICFFSIPKDNQKEIAGRSRSDANFTERSTITLDSTVEIPSVISVDFDYNVKTQGYLDGESVGDPVTVCALSSLSNDLHVGSGLDNATADSIRFVVISYGLSNTEIATLHNVIHVLKDSVVPLPAIESLTANFNQGTAKIYPSTELDDLKQYLTVVAHYDDNSTYTLLPEEMALTGILQEGTSTITVTYNGITATFLVNVSPTPTVTSIDAVFIQGSTTIFPNTPYSTIKSLLTVTANLSDETDITLNSNQYEITGTLTVGTSTLTVTYAGQVDTFDVVVSDGSDIDENVATFCTAANITNATTIDGLNTLVGTLKGAGIWSKLGAIYPFCGENAAGMLYNLKDPTQYNLTDITTSAAGTDYTQFESGKGYRAVMIFDVPYTSTQATANGLCEVVAINPAAHRTKLSSGLGWITSPNATAGGENIIGNNGKGPIIYTNTSNICARAIGGSTYKSTDLAMDWTVTNVTVFSADYVSGESTVTYLNGSKPASYTATSDACGFTNLTAKRGLATMNGSQGANGSLYYFYAFGTHLTDTEHSILANAILAFKPQS